MAQFSPLTVIGKERNDYAGNISSTFSLSSNVY